jgi:hypothetical protein
MTEDYVEEYLDISLDAFSKKTILKNLEFIILDENTINDLKNKRKKWVRFTTFDLNQTIGELNHVLVHSRSKQQIDFLAMLISDLEHFT